MTDQTQEQKDAAAAATAAAAAEKATQEAAAAAAAAAAGGAGDPYAALALPKDVSPAFNVKVRDQVRELAIAHKIPVEAAQAMLDLAHSEVSEVVGAVGEAAKVGGPVWQTRVAALEAAALADPALGNGSPQKLTDVRLTSELYLNREAPALKQKLYDAGLLADPDVLKFCQARVLEAGEDPLARGDNRGAPAKPAQLRDRYNADGSPAEPEA